MYFFLIDGTQQQTPGQKLDKARHAEHLSDRCRSWCGGVGCGCKWQSDEAWGRWKRETLSKVYLNQSAKKTNLFPWNNFISGCKIVTQHNEHNTRVLPLNRGHVATIPLPEYALTRTLRYIQRHEYIGYHVRHDFRVHFASWTDVRILHVPLHLTTLSPYVSVHFSHLLYIKRL